MIQEKQQNRWLSWTLYISLGVVGIGLATVLYWLNAPQDVLKINEPITVRPAHAQREGAVVLNFNFCKLTNSQGTVERRLVSDKTETISSKRPDNTLWGCHENVEVGVSIPAQAVPDTYHFEYTAEYRVNPFKTIVEEFRSEEFTVTDKQL